MTIAAAGLLTGYDGDFPFDKPGDQYGDHNYIGMRVVVYLMIYLEIKSMSVLEQKLNNDLPHCATETSKNFIESTLDFITTFVSSLQIGSEIRNC